MDGVPRSPKEEEKRLLLLKRIQQLESENAHLQRQFSNLAHSRVPRSHSNSPHQWQLAHPNRNYAGSSRDSRTLLPANGLLNFSQKQYFDILESLGQSVHIVDLRDRIVYWNKGAEKLYCHSASEALGHSNVKLLTDVQYYDDAIEIISNNNAGQKYTGTFPVKNKLGKRFVVIVTNSPFYDDFGNLVGVVSCSVDSKPFHREAQCQSSEFYPSPSSSQPTSGLANKSDVDSHLPLQAGIASKISNLASRMTNKIRSKMKTGDNALVNESRRRDGQYFNQSLSETVLSDHRKDPTFSEAGSSRGDIPPSPLGVSFEDTPRENFSTSGGEGEGEGKIGILKDISSRAEAWISKKSMSWQWLDHEREPDFDQKNCSGNYEKTETQVAENDPFGNEASTSMSSFSHANSTSTVSSSISTSSSPLYKFDTETDSLHFEIMWEDLAIGAQIGHGSCGTVYRGLWCGSDVAIKEFFKFEYSDDLLHSFRQEVLLMKRLRHPNVLLFMGAVTSPQHLCIVMEYLPCGSLFQLLRCNTARLNWRRRALMAVDIAQGMNYLHRCNPPVIHRDLKSSNLLVDKNWNVKVGDFGLSRLKHATYLTTKTGKGTPQWMAPEVIRSEPSDEKSDVYSFGVVLWELATQKIPWDTLNPMQVIGAVGFMDRRLEIPEDLNPLWASLIESCWHSDLKCRPTFEELLEKLKALLRQYSIQKPKANITLGQGD
ncbi:hypothetical protein C5167_015057 [Papaver somniferum]|uniref:non-specific serine/threonine protein kinase n=1 Tax=Papaver somniferum TaxID=3469 RepID=A0A4Y7J910_PAPSO|nr:probable serine/threonine-protein kinase roco5 isoform X1 [Papaver somniferum]XP_026457402.1 probable serine/threonine-protein kinase roco5 isoform X1 [Papaver somniferum]XP_026457403.1 probable serine/threonine-protein kinase roco5 isoform X1 [Papaver somniferum]XP_026457404.1 probable serine/threonine-protein kinase roco5 isoform X1 [Papaver somniferum]XP_026457405.1 probable serine/threonine-protein kinase roco5 isoform X1 [Papaver somniferum]XP_026457406.1 probable serine/threonine-prot